jgi:hypothetical protein
MAMPRILDPEGAHLAALRRLRAFAGRRVLEFGCGDGRLTLGIAADAGSVFAFDADAEAVERARRSLPAELAERVAFGVATAQEIRLESRSFDLARGVERELADPSPRSAARPMCASLPATLRLHQKSRNAERVKMHAQIITYQLNDISQAEYLKQMVEPDAPILADVSGLISKVWLADEEENIFGGFYLWESKEAMETFMQSDLVAAVVSRPFVKNVSSVDYTVNEAASKVTRGLK